MKAGTFLGGGNAMLIWLVVILSCLGIAKAFEVFTSAQFWGLIGLNIIMAFGVMGYRSIKAKINATGIDVEAGDRDEDT